MTDYALAALASKKLYIVVLQGRMGDSRPTGSLKVVVDGFIPESSHA